MTHRTEWIGRPLSDAAVAFCWVPFAVLARAFEPHPGALSTLLGATLLLSLAHQPLTLALVYGDPAQFAARRRVFTWSPVIFLAAVIAGSHLSLVLVAVVAGLWNAEHTLMQRYGLTRIYGRKVGQQDGRGEQLMLLSWLGVALLWGAIDRRTPRWLARIDLGATNAQAVRVLTSLRPWAVAVLVPTAAIALGLMVAWVARERCRPVVNPAKHLYLGATALLFAVMLWDPLVGLTAYVGAHAVEYVVTVHRHLGRRYLAADDGGVVGLAVRSPLGGTGVVAGYLVVVGLGLEAIRTWGSADLVTTIFLTVGGLHVFYDGLIWKLRRPSVARGFALAPAGR